MAYNKQETKKMQQLAKEKRSDICLAIVLSLCVC